MATGIAACIVIYFFILYEFSYDRFHKDADEIFVVVDQFDDQFPQNTIPGPFGPTALSDFPEINSYMRLWDRTPLVKYKDRIFEESVLYADTDFFEFFDFPLEFGAPGTVLQNPDAIVLTKETAEKYFGNEPPLGKTISLKFTDEFRDFIVSGLTGSIPDNSSIQFDFVLNINSRHLFEDRYSPVNEWGGNNTVVTLVKLKSKEYAPNLEEKLNASFEKYIASDTFTQIESVGYKFRYMLSPLIDHHLSRTYGNFVFVGQVNSINLYILSGIALFVLLIACFNFTNLSIGNFTTRTKEIGMRKVLGAHRNQLVRQFLYESILISSFATVLGLLVAKLCLPVFNSVANSTIKLDFTGNPLAILFLVGLTILVGLIASIYPTVLFSRYQSIDILRKHLQIAENRLLTKVLISLQFTISIILITASIVIRDQHEFVTDTDLGYNKKDIVVVPLFAKALSPEASKALITSFKNDLLQHPDIIAVTGTMVNFTSSFGRFGYDDNKGFPIIISQQVTDYDFLTTFGIELIEGRNFSKEYPLDETDGVIVNETFVDQFNIKNPIGTTIADVFTDNFPFPDKFLAVTSDRNWQDVFGKETIIGVVKDFHHWTLEMQIEPVMIYIKSFQMNYLNIKIGDTNIQQSVKLIEEVFRRVPNTRDQPFSYTFLEDDVAEQYESEERWRKIIDYSSILAIVMTCSGLFGIVLLTVLRRTKEIGIRKVLGATVLSIVKLINKEFLILVVVANATAIPVAYIIMQKWLQNFAYRISIGPDVFLLSGSIAVIITIITVCFHAVKAGLSNPVDVIRYE